MRCINTPKTPPLRRRCTVARKHQASKDALRLFLAVAFLFNVFIVVRKHRVPKGALRLVLTVDILQDIDVESESTERQKVHYDSLLGTFTEYHASCQKTPSAKRCIKTSYSPVLPVHVPGSQKAPSAKRCIMTPYWVPSPSTTHHVRKHRAPKGALRLAIRQSFQYTFLVVRKHRAPKGALRPCNSRKDCSRKGVRKHRAPKISHVIPRRTITDRRQKPRNINNQISNIERPDRELRATFSSNHAHPLPEVTHGATNRLSHRTLDGSGSEGSERHKAH